MQKWILVAVELLTSSSVGSIDMTDNDDEELGVLVNWDSIEELLDKTTTLSAIIAFAGGYFSVCWNPKPEGVFDSDRAVKFNELLTKTLIKNFGASQTKL